MVRNFAFLLFDGTNFFPSSILPLGLPGNLLMTSCIPLPLSVSPPGTLSLPLLAIDSCLLLVVIIHDLLLRFGVSLLIRLSHRKETYRSLVVLPAGVVTPSGSASSSGSPPGDLVLESILGLCSSSMVARTGPSLLGLYLGQLLA